MTSIVEVMDIQAPPSVVWDRLIDVERWPEWSSGTRSIVRRESGPFGPQSTARVTMRGMRGSVWRVVAFEPGRSFTWESGPMPGLRVVGGHSVEATASGSRVTLTIDLSGAAARLFGPMLDRFSRRNVAHEAEGLRRLCEGVAAPA